MNQCDGCRAGWPLENGVHLDPSGRLWDNIGCTADRYAPEPWWPRLWAWLRGAP